MTSYWPRAAAGDLSPRPCPALSLSAPAASGTAGPNTCLVNYYYVSKSLGCKQCMYPPGGTQDVKRAARRH